ncbi:MAG: hypothetical protein AAFR67_16370, partial [Chloroflexota bacterium]
TLDCACEVIACRITNVDSFSERIQQETLADSLTAGETEQGFYSEDFSSDLPKDLEGKSLVISVKRR